MKRLIAQEDTQLSKKQLDLGGKYFAMSNGGIEVEKESLDNEYSLNSLYYQVSAECGEDEEDNGFDQEAAVWRDRLKKDTRWVEKLKEKLPWLFK